MAMGWGRNTLHPACDSRATGEGAAAVVNFKISPQALLRRPAVAVGMQIHLLVLDRTPEPFDKDVVDPATLANQADAAAGGLEKSEPPLTSYTPRDGALWAAVSYKHKWRPHARMRVLAARGD